MRKISLFTILLLLSINTHAQENSRSFYVLPVGASLNGIGFVYGIAGGVRKLTGTDIDITLAKTFGQIEAFGGLVSGISLEPDLIYIDIGFARMQSGYFDTAYVRNLEKGDVYNLKLEGYGLKIEMKYTPTKWFHLKPGYSQTQAKFRGYTYKDDNVSFDDAGLYDINTDYLTLILDFNFLDRTFRPTSGIFATLGSMYETGKRGQSDVLTYRYQLKGYLPISSSLTWASTIMGSDANVTREKYVDKDKIRNSLDANCSDASSAKKQSRCQELEDDLVEYIHASNTHGTAWSIGGSQYLRSFREGQFRAAHTRAFSTEMRWTFSETMNISYFQKEGYALDFVPFWDIGWANDFEGKIYDHSRNSYGVGLRAYFNPTVVRAEFSTGEGGEIFFLTAGSVW